ncbi:hypothetical protein FOA52_004742 [Chlamydomonas sp. UWO 241]|nr:hypothetical protein FOA52_004742 [Chlamydomonas sp. UWO 241]
MGCQHGLSAWRRGSCAPAAPRLLAPIAAVPRTSHAHAVHEPSSRCVQRSVHAQGTASCSHDTSRTSCDTSRHGAAVVLHCTSDSAAAADIEDDSGDEGCSVPHRSPASADSAQEGTDSYVVVNFYHLVDVPDAAQLANEQRAWIDAQPGGGLDVRGRIYFSPQGVNAQFGGMRSDALAYTEHLRENPLFSSLRFSVWPSPNGHAFPKLRLKTKPNLISLAGGMERLPVTVAEARATPLEPAAWQTMIADAPTRGAVVLDVRNGYEWDAGHFQGSARPSEEVFNETPAGQGEVDVPVQLRDMPTDTPVMMYCTGGIRCDVYSTFLREKGFTNLFSLEGGVQNYLRKNGDKHWNGSLYVFDGRMAIPGNVNDVNTQLTAAVPCQVCGSPAAELPHMNCANIDCNELFISCAPCKERYSGCCCAECMSAPRLLRPLKTDGGHYGAWGNYAVGDDGEVRSLARSDGYVLRRARRREVIKAKREKQLEERADCKAMMRRAMSNMEAAEAEGGAGARVKAAKTVHAGVMAMSPVHAQEEAASAEAIQAALLASDVFGVLFQQLSALRNSPPVPARRNLGFDRSAAAALRLVSRGMRDLVDSVVPQLAVPLCKGKGVSLESCLPRFAASHHDLTVYMPLLGDLSELRDLASVGLPCLEKLELVV